MKQENNMTLVVVPMEQLREEIRSTVNSTMEQWLDKVVMPNSEDVKDGETTITMKQLCSQFHISRPTVYARIASGVLKPLRIGKKVMFIKQDVLEAMKSGKME